MLQGVWEIYNFFVLVLFKIDMLLAASGSGFLILLKKFPIFIKKT